MEGIDIRITSKTKFIISTSGRPSSLRRYKRLLQDILKLDIAYIPISSDSEGNVIAPERFAAALRGMNCLGGAISKDIKHTIIPFLDIVDEFSAKIQSVNTVLVRGDKLVGCNTDALGFRIAISQAIEARRDVEIKTAVCYGYGGVTSVVVHVLKSLGISTLICGRRLEEAEKRATELGAQVWTPGSSAQLFINAAPVTDRPLDQADNFLTALSGVSIAFDHEMPGKFLKEYCEANSVHHIAGVDMYYPQMVEQWALFLEGLVEKSDLPELIKQAEQEAAV